jgi:iron complex transport system substrate-binding protein
MTTLALAGSLVLAGCANREPAATPPPSSPAAQSYPVQVTPPGGEPVVLDRRPERIVSLSASSTEMLFAIGAGGQVVAVDDQSTFPPEAPKTTLSGLAPNIESIAGYNPDLVIASGDANDLTAGMAKLGKPVLILTAAKTLDDVYGQLDLLGTATGHPAEAGAVAGRMKDEIGKIVADTPKPATSLRYYHELDNELYSATSKTFIGQVYSLFGLTNIADPADLDAGGYPNLSAEHILQANPDLIFLADTKCCGQNAQTVAARPGWSTVKAVQTGNVVPLDDDLASRWGPRVVDLVRAVSSAVAKASGQGG